MNGTAWTLVTTMTVLCVSCSGHAGSPETPACSLSGERFETRLGEIGSLLDEHCREVKELPEGFAFRFEGGRKTHGEVTALAHKEQACCPFLTWEIEEPRDGSFWVRLIGAKEFVRANLGDELGV